MSAGIFRFPRRRVPYVDPVPGVDADAGARNTNGN